MKLEAGTNFSRLAPEVTFEISDEYLIAHTVSAKKSDLISADNLEDIKALKRKAIEKNKDAYKALAGIKSYESCTSEEKQAVDKLVQYLLDTPEYQRVREQTQANLNQVKSEWQENLATTTEVMIQMTGIDFSRDKYQVFLTHPSIKQGQYRGDNQIAWGGQDYWDNYSTIYIWHEILHSDDKLGRDSNIKHAIIELIADNELRKRLNNVDYPPFEGHSSEEYSLDGIRAALMSDWLEFLANPDEGI